MPGRPSQPLLASLNEAKSVAEAYDAAAPDGRASALSGRYCDNTVIAIQLQQHGEAHKVLPDKQDLQ